MALEWRKDDYRITTDPAEVDLDVVHGFLSRSYWAENVPREVVERSIRRSLAFTLQHQGRQVGFARVVSDCATVAYVADVFVLESHRGRGLSKWLLATVVGHPELQGLRRWILLTRDAHGLYEQVGFRPPLRPERWMERWAPDIYRG